MGLKSDTREIDGRVTHSTQFPALDAFALMAKLGRILAPVVGAIGPERSAEGALASLMKRDLGPALMELFIQLDSHGVAALCTSVLASTSVEHEGKNIQLNSKAKIDLAFEGRLTALLETLRFALEVNFSDFFDAVKVSAASPSPATEKTASLEASTPK